MSATTASDPLASTRLTGPVYVDASALVKLYFPDSDSARLNRRLAGRRDFVASDLAVTEVVSSLARRQRDGMLCAPRSGDQGHECGHCDSARIGCARAYRIAGDLQVIVTVRKR
jgi:uncharacterized protein with PIN domain